MFNHGDIVVIMREPKNHQESVCVICNISMTETALPYSIPLEGNIVDSEVWLQSDLAVYEGQTTQTEVVNTKNFREFFEVETDKVTGNDVLRAPSLPAGFACYFRCEKNDFHK